MVRWSEPTDNQTAYRRAGGRARINKQRRVKAFWLGLEVWHLGYLGLLPLEIAAELNISPVTAYRHYWRYFGKRRPAIARQKRLQERIEAELSKLERRLKRAKNQPVNRAKLTELLEALRQHQSGAVKDA